ncbi:uncharacterized protein I303_105911 [Kwoniella dejecticola CBS 10117]|uniref:Uncharacterized protein n=1 Tax=Kwoniella dejecticola CBS 10117 TaxID=1296121 RepID=A0A1A6A0S6_9TREE|nr:uncharacterized protein I303_05933 [Kwoniella dejecticola CBS 10117]OBR83653.1 hypothetical protein I303_05933 [Kwoniella dejecticola CBS 10117]
MSGYDLPLGWQPGVYDPSIDLPSRQPTIYVSTYRSGPGWKPRVSGYPGCTTTDSEATGAFNLLTDQLYCRTAEIVGGKPASKSQSEMNQHLQGNMALTGQIYPDLEATLRSIGGTVKVLSPVEHATLDQWQQDMQQTDRSGRSIAGHFCLVVRDDNRSDEDVRTWEDRYDDPRRPTPFTCFRTFSNFNAQSTEEQAGNLDHLAHFIHHLTEYSANSARPKLATFQRIADINGFKLKVSIMPESASNKFTFTHEPNSWLASRGGMA